MIVSPLRWRLMTATSRVINTAKIAAHAPFVFRNWPYFLSSRFQDREGVLELRNGLRFRIRPGSTDRASVSEVFILDSYEPVPSGASVIDVGANIGAFTLCAAQRAKIVYALEPVSNIFEALRRNVELNGMSNVSLHRVAMSGENGEAQVSVAGMASSIHFQTRGSSLERVPTVTLESFMDGQRIAQVDYLKMDCEGAEWDILLKTAPSVLSRIRHIELEFHNIGDETDPQMLQEHLSSAGFQSTASRGKRFNGILVADRPGSPAH
jgi:FkbM family methyltransferase